MSVTGLAVDGRRSEVDGEMLNGAKVLRQLRATTTTCGYNHLRTAMPFPLVFVLALLVQGTPATRPTDGLALLQDVAQQYSQAKSYHVEVVRELTTSNELARSWGKTLLTAIVAPGGRYRYEGRSGYSWAVLVSDGTTRWNYHVHEGLYMQTDALAPDPDTRRVITQEEFAAEEAKRVVSEIYALSKRLKSATLVDD